MKIIEMEKRMNEQKLKMLIKFEKIKLLEDFYNKYNTEQPICLEIEIKEDEMRQTALKVY